MSPMGKLFALAVIVASVSGCNYGAASFSCANNNQCGAGGLCEPDAFCSFPDSSCSTGRRYGDLSGARSNECVGVGEQPAVDAAVEPDAAALDASPDAPSNVQVCFSASLLPNLNVCFEAAPTEPRTISAGTSLDTDAPNACARVLTGGTGLCVIVATTISVEATLRATGTRSLVLIARDSITITSSGAIDVASPRSLNPAFGAGGDPGTCTTGMLPTRANGTNGGGAGGSFVGLGGRGGNAGGVPGGLGGFPAAVVTPITELRGGCPGQDGQGALDKGHGGGAVLLLAGSTITVTGKINASGGAGGGGASGNAGGGGGGSGGMIVLNAPTVTGTGLILANGGGGGEGSGALGTESGNPGADPTSTTAAPGGSLGMNAGGDGGNGSAGTMPAGAAGGNVVNASAIGGGGGGGGGAGTIRVPVGHTLGSNVSPAVTAL